MLSYNRPSVKVILSCNRRIISFLKNIIPQVYSDRCNLYSTWVQVLELLYPALLLLEAAICQVEVVNEGSEKNAGKQLERVDWGAAS